ncbi:MAG: methyltransferase [Bacteroidetes bacterium]|nr:methyltransferase [Bacteroidota bacterium]MDA1176676.1 methyltransferase [Bacteroidota bacterium]
MALDAFQFKQFSVAHDKCAMKVGTDAVLLGAWAYVDHRPKSILDIGAGSGILALMLAQRSSAEFIDALEIDASAYEQCVANFEQSPWRDRLFCYHASLEEFTEEIEDKYDLIISNPPFYTNPFDTQNYARNIARFEHAMPFKHLIESVSKLLADGGQFCVIIPYSAEKTFCTLAQAHGLFCHNIVNVRGEKQGEFKRCLMALSFENRQTNSQEMHLEDGRHSYSKAYKSMTKEFYLKF